jgi:hypothetical protein
MGSSSASSPASLKISQLVDVDDGGFYYWRIQYQIDRKRFLEVDINSDS